MRTTLAFLCAFAAASSAAASLRVAPGGQGEALYLPYFTALDGRSTLVSLNNEDTSSARAVRLVVGTPQGSVPMFEGTVFLAAGDSFNAAIVFDAEHTAPRFAMAAQEKSCLVAHSPIFALPIPIEPTSEPRPVPRYGSIEAIEIGVPRGQALEALNDSDCEALNDVLAADLQAPAGKLSLSAEIVDAANGLMWSYDAVALEGFSRTSRLPADVVRITTPHPGGDGKFLVQTQGGETVTLPGDRPADATSLALAAAALVADYAVSFDDSRRSEWVIALPTRFEYLNSPSGPQPPFLDECEKLPIEVVGRNGESLAPPLPDAITHVTLCDQVTHFELLRPRTFIPESGEGRVHFDLGGSRPPIGTSKMVGLPAVGVAFQSVRFPGERDALGRVFTSAHPMRRDTAMTLLFPGR